MGNSNSGVVPGIVPEEVQCERFKVLIVGPPNTGKSCIFKRYVSMQFSEQYEPDLTVNVGAKLVGIDGLPTINLELWDVPGTLDPNLEDIYFKDADGVVLVFDVADAKKSTEHLSAWFDRIAAYEQRAGINTLPKVKFGNKRDLIHGVLWHHYDSSKAPPRKGRAIKFAAFATCPSFTVSAKDFGGIHSAFKQVIAEVYNLKHPLPTTASSNDSKTSKPPRGEDTPSSPRQAPSQQEEGERDGQAQSSEAKSDAPDGGQSGEEESSSEVAKQADTAPADGERKAEPTAKESKRAPSESKRTAAESKTKSTTDDADAAPIDSKTSSTSAAPEEVVKSAEGAGSSSSEPETKAERLAKQSESKVADKPSAKSEPAGTAI